MYTFKFGGVIINMINIHDFIKTFRYFIKIFLAVNFIICFTKTYKFLKNFLFVLRLFATEQTWEYIEQKVLSLRTIWTKRVPKMHKSCKMG